MAIAFVQKASNGAANAGPVTVTISAAGAGNLLLAYHVDGDTADNAMPAITTPAMTDVGTSEQYANSTNDCNSKAWYFYAVGGETSVVFPDTGGGTNDGVSGAVMEFSGVASAAQGGPFSTAIQKATGTGSAHADPPQIATTAGDCVVIMGGAAHATAGVTFTAPTNYTTNALAGTAGTDTISSGAGMAYRLSGYANPENPGAFTASATAAGDSWNAVTLALKPAPPPVLVIADTASASLADNVVLTQHNILAVADTASASLIDNLTLTAHDPGNGLIIQDAADASLIDNVVLTQHNVLAVQDTASASLVDNLALTQHNVLAVQDTASTSTADNIALVQHNVLVVQDATSGSTIDNVVLSIPDEGSDFTSGWRAGSAYFSKS